ncbi:MAG: MFS transporter [Peptococcaceae bacterium]|jgi:nitrate/nitrite transporter NarK|nr:MFS transporter [Peptococcaceae bacterium]
MAHEESFQPDGYRWVMLILFVLLSLFLWSAWFAQAPLLDAYWGKVFHIGAATGNLLLSLPGLVAIFLGVSTGRWLDTVGTKKMLGIGAICGLVGFGLRPLFMTSFPTQAVLTVIAGYSICALTASLGPLMIEWFGHEKAHSFIGIGAGSFFIGGGLGIIVTVSLLGPLGLVNTFWVYSILILVITVLWWILARGKETAGRGVEKPSFASEFKNVMQAPSAWVNLLVAVFVGGATVFAMGFLPMQMAIANKLSPATAGTIAGLFPIAMGAGLIFLPPLAGRWGRKVTGLIFMIITLAVWLVYSSQPSWAIGGLILAAILFGLFFEVPWALAFSLQESMPGVTPVNMGVAAGAYTVGTNIGVFVLPLILGSFVQSAGLAGGTWSLFVTYLIALVALIIVKEKKA